MPDWVEAWERIDWDPFARVFWPTVSAWVAMLIMLPAYPVLWNVRLLTFSLVVQTSAVVVGRIVDADRWRRWYREHNAPASIWLHEDDDLIRPRYEQAVYVGTRTAVYTPPPAVHNGLITLARQGALEGEPLTFARWTPRRNGFSELEFRFIRSELLRRGWASEEGGKGDMSLTVAGRAMLRRYADLPPVTPSCVPRARA